MKKGKLSKAASLFLSLMLVLTMVPSVGTDTAWAADDTSGTEKTPTISFSICNKTTDKYKNEDVTRTLNPGQSLTKECNVENTTNNVEYMASFASDGKTLLLNNYSGGTIVAYNASELTIELKGTSKIQQFINRTTPTATAINDTFLTGISVDPSGARNNPFNLTIISADSSTRGKLVLENEEVLGVDAKTNEIYGITAKSLTLDNVELVLNLKNDKNRTSCTALSTLEGMTIRNGSTVNINISDFVDGGKVNGLYSSGGTLSIEKSTVNVNFENCTINGYGYLYGIVKNGDGTDEKKGDILIKSSDVSIKAENNGTTNDDDYIERKYGIYCKDSNSTDGNCKIIISDDSWLIIDGGTNKFGYGILDEASVESEYANCAGVIVDKNRELNISNVKYGISSYKRGVDMIDANVTVNADDTAVYGYLFDTNNKNLGKYGLHVTGNSHVALEACTNAVKVNHNGVDLYSEGVIDLSDNGYLRMSITRDADETIDSPTQDVGIITADEVLRDAFRLGSNTAITRGAIRVHSKSDDFYTAQSDAPSTLDDGRKKYELEFKCHNGDILDVKWNQDTNEVGWSDNSLQTKYQLTLEGAENNGSTEPEYKELTKIVGPYEGKSYTLPKNITDMMIPTMNYRIKVTPFTTNTNWKTIDSMASYSNIKSATERVAALDLTKIGYWQIGWPAVEKAQAYYYEVKRYNEETEVYETVFERTNYKSDDRKQEVFDLRNGLMSGQDWCEPGKYILSVTATAGGNENNVLARGNTTEPIVFKYNTLHGSTDKDLNAKFTTKVSRNTAGYGGTWINGDDDTDNDFDPSKLLYDDEVTLTYKPAADTSEKMNGWYVKSNIINMKTTEGTDNDGNKTLTFTMPLNSDVTAYPLLGTDEIGEATLEYNRNYSDNISKGRLVMVAKRFENASSFDNYFSNISITWEDEKSNSVGALTEKIDDTKNYVGTVKLTPASGKYFAEGMTVTLSDIDEDTNEWRTEYIGNGEVKDGCYYFDIYLINMPKITIPFVDDTLSHRDATAELVNKQKLYEANAGEPTTGADGFSTINEASVTTELMNVLFADTPQLMVNDKIYPAKLSLDGDSATVKSTDPIIIYPTPAAPVLNYPSGTTFYADYETETEIKVVKLDTAYLNTLKNPAAKINYSYKTSDSNSTVNGSVAKNYPITFKMKGSRNVNSPTSVTLTVWVDNGPKTSYTYYAVDALTQGTYPYIPRLTPGSTDFSGSLQVKLANPLPNIKYYYTTDDKIDAIWDNSPENWGTLTEYTGPITVSTTTVIHLVGKNSEGQYTKTAKETYNSYSDSEYMLKGTITSQGSASDPITVTLKQKGENDTDTTAYEQTVYGNSAAYSFRLTQSGEYLMEVSKNKHKTYTATVNVNASSTRTVDVDLTYVSIGGTVTSSGDDNDDVTITLTGKYYNDGSQFTETLTGKGYSMNYCFDVNKIALNLEKASEPEFNIYTIEIKKPGHGIQTKTVDLNEESVPYTWDVKLEQTSVKISGGISFSEGMPVINPTVLQQAVEFKEKTTGDSANASTTYTDDGISYLDTDHLKPNTDYTMTVHFDGYLTHTEILHTGTKPMTKDITLTRANPSKEDTFAVSGKLITPGGRTEDAVEIALIPEETTEPKYQQSVKDTEYIFTDVEQGTYKVTAKKLGFIVGLIDGDDAIKVDYEAVSCDIQLDPVKISGTVTTADNSKDITLTLTKDGETIPKYTKTISAADFTPDGDKYIAEYLFGGDGGTEFIEPGTYSLTATQAPAAEGEDPVSCTAKNIIVAYNDCSQNLDLTKPAGVTVSGTVTSWNDENDVVYLLYAGDTLDKTIRDDWKASKTTNVLYSTWGSSITANADGKRYDQQFSFSGVAAGTYKLAILKPGHGIWIETITVGNSDNSGKNIELYKMGDVTCDGKVDLGDQIKLIRYVKNSKKYPLTADQFIAADVTVDGNVNMGDQIKLIRYVKNSKKYPLY